MPICTQMIKITKMENSNLFKTVIKATYNILFTNGLVINYATDTVDFINDYPHKFSKSLYALLRHFDKSFDNYSSVLKKRVETDKNYSFTYDSSNIVYTQLQKDILIMENSFNVVLRNNEIEYHDIKAKVQTLFTLCNLAEDTVNEWIKILPNNIRISNDSVAIPAATFKPLKISDIMRDVDRLYGMFSPNADFNNDINCQRAKQIVVNKLTSYDFILSVFTHTECLEKDISYEDLQIDKLKQHFNSKTL